LGTVSKYRRSHVTTSGQRKTRRYKGSMNEHCYTAPGIEVREKPLNRLEQGFLTGVFEAFANRTLTEEEFRVLIAQVADHHE
jgi:predicted hydrocarbon binding protein